MAEPLPRIMPRTGHRLRLRLRLRLVTSQGSPYPSALLVSYMPLAALAGGRPCPHTLVRAQQAADKDTVAKY